MNLSRRTFIIGASTLVAAAGASAWLGRDSLFPDSTSTSAVAHNPLAIPPLLEGTTFDLTLAASSQQFFAGSATPTYGYNGESFWGPTMRWRKGDTITLNVTNALDEATTTHWHGIHLPAAADGGPHQPIEPGAMWSPSFDVMNDSATFWYHPHMHEMTQKQLTMGAGGFIIVDDDNEAMLGLPRDYGVNDIPLVLTSRRFDSNNAFDVAKTTAYGDYVLTNGVLNADVTMPAELVRFRILNAETERYINLGFENDRVFSVIGTDGGLLNAPVPVTRLKIVPGERYEILLDLSQEEVGSSFDMKAFNGGMTFGAGGSEPATTGDFGSLLNNTTFSLLRLSVGVATASGITAIPSALAANVMLTLADATNARSIAITDNGPGTPFTFDGMAFDMMMIDQTIALGEVEAWTIKNDHVFGHAFHIHDVQFSLISRSGGPLADYEKGWKDTFAIMPDESVTFVAKFTDFASPTDSYMYHCHMANHEDGGLMGQFLVV